MTSLTSPSWWHYWTLSEIAKYLAGSFKKLSILTVPYLVHFPWPYFPALKASVVLARLNAIINFLFYNSYMKNVGEDIIFTFLRSQKLRFYAPGLKGPSEVSSVLILRLSVRPSVCPSVRNSVPLMNKVQYLKFWWSYSNQTWVLSSFKGCSHFTDITYSLGWGGVKM